MWGRGICLAVVSSVMACGSDDGGGGADGNVDGTDAGSVSASTGGTDGVDGGRTGSADGVGTDDSAGTTGGIKFDLGAGETETGGPSNCECGSQLGFSYIWIANSIESAVSKINTETMVEEGRYLTRPDGNGNPSRTSVALSGRKAAVANRNGGVVAIWSREQYCDPNKNGMPGLQTSAGANEVLAWDQDDCVAWYTDFDYYTQRPIAWAPGTLDQASCEYEGELLWTSGCTPGEDTNIVVHRLDGDDGTVLDTVEVTDFPCQSFAGYGGAVDPDGNFWITDRTDHLARIDAQSLATDVWITPITAYGMTVDHAGRPWLQAALADSGATAARFDPATETWAIADNNVGCAATGMQEDAQGRMWFNYWRWGAGCSFGVTSDMGGVAYVDVDTMQVSEPYPFEVGLRAKGLSVDLNGNVWAIAQASLNGTPAFRFDPDTMQLDRYDGLNQPYTYSDMTGWALQNASCDPEG